MRLGRALVLLLLFVSCVKRVPSGERTVVFVTQQSDGAEGQTLAWRGDAIVALGSRREVLSQLDGDVVIETFPQATIEAGQSVNASWPWGESDDLSLQLKREVESLAQQGVTEVMVTGISLSLFRHLQQWDMFGALPIRVMALVDGQGAEAELFLGLGPFVGRHLELTAVQAENKEVLGAFVERGFKEAPSGEATVLRKLEVGLPADFVVRTLTGAKVLVTVVAGVDVYRAPELR